MRKNSTIILLMAVLMGGGAAFMARTWLNTQVGSAAANPPAGHIVVATEPLAYGATVTADSVAQIPWFTDTLPEGAFASKEELHEGGRRVVLSRLNRGEPVLRSKVTGPGQRGSLATL